MYQPFFESLIWAILSRVRTTNTQHTTHSKTLNHIIPLQTTLQSLFERSYVALYITLLYGTNIDGNTLFEFRLIVRYLCCAVLHCRIVLYISGLVCSLFSLKFITTIFPTDSIQLRTSTYISILRVPHHIC